MEPRKKKPALDFTGAPICVHLIGVAGSGMSGIAGLLIALGHRVSGSDKVSTVEVERLQSLGLEFSSPHRAEAVLAADVVVFSSAIKPGNVAYDEAVRLEKKMMRRADALAALMNFRRGIVVAGMHGKTTTAAMAAHVLRAGGLRPSHYVGAEIPILGTNANWEPDGELFVAEGDESDGTLALYHPEHAIILNIEEEHLDYYADLAAIEAVFRELISHTRGLLFFCADDEHAARICAPHPGAIGFGESANARYRLESLEMYDLRSTFDVLRDGKSLGSITLSAPGKHNASNALCVVALATELGVPFDRIAEALESFRGARRRFEVKYRGDDYLVVDDYAHHPSEIRATLATAKTAGRKRIIAIFQPHRYSRTLALREQFGSAFTDADEVFITDIYAASEQPIEGVTGKTIAEEIARTGHKSVSYKSNRHEILRQIGRKLEAGDMILTLGAGDIHEQSRQLAADLGVLDQIRRVAGPSVIRLYEPLSKHTTLGVGGPAQFWVEPETESGFASLVRFCSEAKLSLTALGRGSNLLVRDGGIRGVVAHLVRGEFRRLEVDGSQISAGVGVKLRELSYAAREAELSGFEWMEGIPGNVGGGLRMNAGAMGGETFDNVLSVRLVDSAGNCVTKKSEELDVGYRNVPMLRNNYAVSAIFRGVPSSRAKIQEMLDASMRKRRETQPAAASAGCIFKNPGSGSAGKIVDELGLKNFAIGSARVSEVHGNFIVNDGGASAREVIELIDKIKTVARRERGIELETEVQIVGEN
ncbi:MAG: UDP-N-acetylmuramate--L-alanine ligase [Verrucomicrobiota bacterium]|nr:UDP-N-acetylmuramate--L-alanine ligase [Verrucomicrobiota bacterium]